MQCTFQNVQWEAAVSLNSLFAVVVEVCVHMLHLHNWVLIPNTGEGLLNPVSSHLASEKVTGLILKNKNKSVFYFCFSIQGKVCPFVPIM